MGNAYHRNQLFNIIIMGLYAAWVYFNSHFPLRQFWKKVQRKIYIWPVKKWGAVQNSL